jgi:hypothetical protein
MPTGSIVINLDGLMWNDAQVTFLIQGTNYVMPPASGQGVGVSGLAGATTVLVNASQAMLQGQTGNLSGIFHLTAAVGASDPTLTMFGAAALPGTAVATWTQGDGGEAYQSLAEGTITLTGFGAW